MARKKRNDAPIDLVIPEGAIEAYQQRDREMREFFDGALKGVDANDGDAVFGALLGAAMKRIKKD